MLAATSSSIKTTAQAPLIARRNASCKVGQSIMDECKIDIVEESHYFSANLPQCEIPTQKSSVLLNKIFHSLKSSKRFDVEKKILEFLNSNEIKNLHILNKHTWKNVFKSEEILKERTALILEFFKIDAYLELAHTFFLQITNLSTESQLRQEVLAKKDVLNPDLTEQDYFVFSLDIKKIFNLENPKSTKKEVQKLIQNIQELKNDVNRINIYENSTHVSFSNEKLLKRRLQLIKYYLASLVFILTIIIILGRVSSTFFEIEDITMSVTLLSLQFSLLLLIFPRSQKFIYGLMDKFFKDIKDKKNNQTLSLLLSDLSLDSQNKLKEIYNIHKVNLDENEHNKLNNILKLLFTTDYFKIAKQSPRPRELQD